MSLDFFVHYRYPGDGTELDLASTAGVRDDHRPKLGTLVFGQAVCGTVAQTQTPMACADVDRSGDDRLTLAASLGARSYASYPLLDGAELLGTLSFGSRTRPSLTESELEVLQLATDVLGAAIAHHRDHTALGHAQATALQLRRQVEVMSEQTARLRLRVEQLTAAVASHDQIATVKGMLMVVYRLSEDQAWRLLVRLSQTTNRKVRDLVTVVSDHLLQRTPLPEDLRGEFPSSPRT